MCYEHFEHLDEIQVAVKEELISVVKFYNSKEELELYNKQKEELVQLQEQGDTEAKEKLKELITAAETRAIEYKNTNNLTCDIGHKDDYFYVTEDNFLIDAFRRGLDKAVKDLKIKVPLGLAWNSGHSWADTH